MANIAILHPQCVRLGGAIQMALRTAHALQRLWHTVTLYTFERSDDCFPDLQKWITIEVWPRQKTKDKVQNNSEKNTTSKLMSIISLAWHLRHVDTIIANNPPMQIVAALAKIFSLKIKIQKTEDKIEDYKNKKIHHFSFCTLHFVLSTLWTVWWHHHTPWYITTWWLQKRFQEAIFWKGILERFFIVPNIDTMIATSHFVAEKIQEYCKSGAVVIHPVVELPYFESRKPLHEGVTLFTHGRLEPGKGLDMIVNVWKKLKTEGKNINLKVFWTGSLESELREQGVDVSPFDKNKTFVDILSGEYGHILGVYCSSIDAFGMAPLECQMAGISTLVLDNGGARETMLSSDDNIPVGYLVQSEEDLSARVSYYIEHKFFDEKMSNVNFYHTKDYYSPDRLSSDLLSVINKTHQ